MAQRRQNPSGGALGPIILLGGAGIALYLAYQNNWGGIDTMFNFGTPTPAPAPASGTGTNNPITNPNTTLINAPVAPPPLGTVATSGNQVTAQATAGYAYILPGPGIDTSTAPNGYSTLTTTDYGPVFLRNNVYSAVDTVIQNRIQRAISQGAAATSVQAAGNETLQNIQTVMSTNGLAGLGYYSRNIMPMTLRGGW